MKKITTTRNSDNKFAGDFSSYNKVGFHATSLSASKKIEQEGFLPNKVFTEEEHEKILTIAKKLSVDIESYSEWLNMRSVTFAIDSSSALQHIKYGNSGGQGLKGMQQVLTSIVNTGCSQDKEIAEAFIERINKIHASQSVIYAVDLSNTGCRLVKDNHQPLYHLYFNPDEPLPSVSIVSYSNVIEMLEVVTDSCHV